MVSGEPPDEQAMTELYDEPRRSGPGGLGRVPRQGRPVPDGTVIGLPSIKYGETLDTKLPNGERWKIDRPY